MQVTKLKVGGGKVEVEWTEVSDDKKAVTHRMTSKEAPVSEMREALGQLSLPASMVCEVADCQVLGVTWKRDKEEGVVLALMRKLQSTAAPMCWSTPYLRLQLASPTELVLALRKGVAGVEAQAENYIRGLKAQMELGFDDGYEEAEGAEDAAE